MNHNLCAACENISLRPLHRCDIEKLRIWRNDKDLNKFLRPIPTITEAAQKKWYETYLTNSHSYLFVVIDNDNAKVIGTIGISDSDESFVKAEKKSAEIGQIVIGDATERGKGIGYRALLLAMCIGFRELGIVRYRLHVFGENIIALNLYIKIGFERVDSKQLTDTGQVELSMEITKEEFEEKNRLIEEVVLFHETAEDAMQLEEFVYVCGGRERDIKKFVSADLK